jgi:hypothetical protein
MITRFEPGMPASTAPAWAEAAVEETIGIGEATDNRADQDELANRVRKLEREIDGKFPAMGTADKNRMTHFSAAE